MTYVSPGWPPERFHNGVVTYTANMRSELRRKGARVFVLTRRMGSGPDSADVVALHLNDRKGNALTQLAGTVAERINPRWWRDKVTTAAILRAVTKLENGGGVQLLEMEESFGWAGAVQRNGRIPVVVRIHGPRFLVGPVSGIPQDAAFRRRVRNEGRAIESAAGVSCPSQSVLDQVRSHYGLALANAEVIPNPIAPVPVADRWRIGHCRPDRILFVGRFDRCKGGDLIIEAFAKVVRQHPQAHLTFVGPDRELVDDLGRPWRAEELIRRRIPDPVSRSHVDYLGYLPAPEINRLRQGCFLTVVCSRFENFPNVALEGMAFGCPLVLSDVGGLPEIVQHEQNGLLCRSGDAEDLADKILRLLRDRALAARLARQAASDAEQRYHPQVIAERTLEFYRRVIERANSKQRDRCRRW